MYEVKSLINNCNPHARVKYGSYGGSISIEITLPTSPYNIFLNDPNGHGC
jgi:hypothetical protein